MNYDLAKQLKDAGFPLKAIMRGDTHGHYWREVFATDEHKGYLIPTLEELIEACPKISTLMRTGLDGNMTWAADAVDHPEISGSTPTEAVARLWLALHVAP